MANKMLIDAAHPEETRVVVLRGNRVEEFDFESASKKQLRGNIYLAKVTRVEPSLQAAFVEYGGNRHGFLAFSEIHPDYYQIPVADRQALLEDEARSQDEDEEESRPSGQQQQRRSRRHRRGGPQGERRGGGRPDDQAVEANGAVESEPRVDDPDGDETEAVRAEAPTADLGFGDVDPAQEEADLGLDDLGEADTTLDDPGQAEDGLAGVGTDDAPAEIAAEIPPAPDYDALPMRAGADDAVVSDAEAGDGLVSPSDEGDAFPETVTTLEHGYEAEIEADAAEQPAEGRNQNAEADGEDEGVEQIGGDALEDVPRRSARPRRHYKIQEVIKRRQIILVQVVKEERGNKGAALTTYLSLAGRYSVLMPNTARGGGISRKITDADDRKRLKAIAQELEVPDGMGIILRTAGAARGIAEVKRDFEYLLRMWETVRETTLQSSAPNLVYEEGSLIKRAIRDLYGKEIDEVQVAGEEAYKEARDFMRLLMPSHARNVIAYRDPQPLFAKSGVEAQLDAMFSSHVVLRSGGYLVINQTEALVAIDVNSGRSTREHNIEDTALRTNLEAADEIARQLRLRDLAGLIVVDFIDMEEGRNDRAVERRIKDALKNDRARIQIGRISHFGLLEMSRQRIRTGVLEGSTVLCPHCGGAGSVRSVSSIALHVLRLLEDTLIKSAAFNLTVRTRAEVAAYILNQKRGHLLDLEMRFGVAVAVLADPLMIGTVYHAIERGTEATPPTAFLRRPAAAEADAALLDEEADAAALADADEDGSDEGDEEVQARDPDRAAPSQEADGDGQRRRRRRRRRRGRDQPGTGEPQTTEAETAFETAADVTETEPGAETADGPLLRFGQETAAPGADDLDGFSDAVAEAQPVPAAALADEAAPAGDDPAEPAVPDDAPRRRRSRRTRAGDAVAPEAGEEAAAPARRSRRTRARPVEPEAAVPSPDPEVTEVADATPGESAPPESDLFEGDQAAVAPAEVPVAAEPASVAAQPVAAVVPEPVRPIEPDLDRPKRSGWWQRAKATFTQGS